MRETKVADLSKPSPVGSNLSCIPECSCLLHQGGSDLVIVQDLHHWLQVPQVGCLGGGDLEEGGEGTGIKQGAHLKHRGCVLCSQLSGMFMTRVKDHDTHILLGETVPEYFSELLESTDYKISSRNPLPS